MYLHTLVLFVFYSGMTRGEVLRYAIAFALRRSRKVIRGLKAGLTEEERYAVADHAVAQLKGRGATSTGSSEDLGLSRSGGVRGAL